eukprot:m.145461 g.145461  ORF g.145461 m.145461 type:complete len:348 (-) comp10078_c0_seq3:24-1067(-)
MPDLASVATFGCALAGYGIVGLAVLEAMAHLAQVPQLPPSASALEPFLSHTAAPVVVDLLLLLVFGISHSFMATFAFKRSYLRSFLPAPLLRTVYCAASAVCIMLMVRFWETSPAVLWDIRGSRWLDLLRICSWLAWGLIGCSFLNLDSSELVGLKQTYNYIMGFQPPQASYSRNLLSLYRHCRHPIFLSFLFVVLATPLLTLDRAMMAFLFVVYMTAACEVSEVRSLLAMPANTTPPRKGPIELPTFLLLPPGATGPGRRHWLRTVNEHSLACYRATSTTSAHSCTAERHSSRRCCLARHERPLRMSLEASASDGHCYVLLFPNCCVAAAALPPPLVQRSLGPVLR